MNSRPIATSIVMVVVFILGLLIGHYGLPERSSLPGTTTSVTPANTPSDTDNGTTTTAAGTEAGTTVNTSSLSPSQKAMLKTLGIDAETIVVTPAMIACAEAAVGVSRAEEIKNGATPSFSEGVKLVACYK